MREAPANVGFLEARQRQQLARKRLLTTIALVPTGCVGDQLTAPVAPPRVAFPHWGLARPCERRAARRLQYLGYCFELAWTTSVVFCIAARNVDH